MRAVMCGVGLSMLLLSGCGDGDDGAASDDGADASAVDVSSSSDGSSSTEPASLDTVESLDSEDAGVSQPDVSAPVGDPVPEGQLIEVLPGGDTLCARGTPFRFFVHGAASDKVVIDFQGGGACWSELTCGLSGAIFSDTTGDLDEFQSYRDDGLLTGVYDFENADNPFYGYTLVHIPYCTGDIHWGDSTVEYSDELTIHHRGYRNVQAVFDWLSVHYPNAERVVSTGCSAGAYGAIGHAPTLADMFPEARITVIADGGAGVITDDFLANSFPNWNAEANMPMELEGLEGKSVQDLTLVDFYVAVAAAYPEMRVAQHTTAYDKDQIFYYSAMGGGDIDWNGALTQSLSDIRVQADNFRYYLSPGPIHCIHPYDLTYTREVNGVSYNEWARDLTSGDELPDDVVCLGDCRDDPVCAGCKDGSVESSACHWCDGWEP